MTNFYQNNINDFMKKVNDNIEIDPRIYAEVRLQAPYNKALEILEGPQKSHPLLTKSRFMAGLGETKQEVVGAPQDMREMGCDFLTIGQYLQPRPDRLSVVRYIPQKRLKNIRKVEEKVGFRFIASGPFVRSLFDNSCFFLP